LRQRSERADLLCHGDNPPHAEFGDVYEVRKVIGVAVNVRDGVLRFQRSSVRVQQFVNGTRVIVSQCNGLRTDFAVHCHICAGHHVQLLWLLSLLLMLFRFGCTTQTPAHKHKSIGQSNESIFAQNHRSNTNSKTVQVSKGAFTVAPKNTNTD